MTSTVTDVSELFDLLESSRPATVAEIKNLIAENFNTSKIVNCFVPHSSSSFEKKVCLYETSLINEQLVGLVSFL